MLIGIIAEELLNGFGISSGGVDAVLDADIFPPATIRVPGFLLLEGPFNDGDTIYQAFVSGGRGAFPNLFVDPDTFYPPARTTIVTIAPPLFRDDLATDSIRSPTVLSKVLGPALFVDVDIFGGIKKLTQGKATINQTFPIDKVTDVDVIFSPIVERAGLVTIPGQTVVSTGEAVNVGTTTIRTVLGGGHFRDTAASAGLPPLGYLAPNLIGADDTFVVPDARRPIAPSIFTDADVFFAPTRLNYVAPIAVLDGDVFFAPFTARQLRPSAVVDADNIIGPSLAQPGSFALFVDAGESIPAPTIFSGKLAADTVVDGDAFFIPSADYVGLPSAFTTADVCYAPTIGQPVSLTQLLSSSRAGLGSMVVSEDGKTRII